MFRPCIDLHEGQVKQIVGGTLGGDPAGLQTNFVSERSAAWYAELYRKDQLTGGHVIMLGPGNEAAARAALGAYPGGLQIGGGINLENARAWLDGGASHVIVTSWVFREGRLEWERLRALVAALGRERLVGATNLDLLQADILADKHTIAPAALDTLRRRARALSGETKLVANLPYQAATPLLAELVLADPPPERLVFTVQDEVAQRLAAEPGTREYGPVGVLIQALAEVEILRRLSPSVFWPRPKVWSSMVRVRPSDARRRRIADIAVLRHTIEGLFIHRRKRAARSLALADRAGASPQQWVERLKAAGLDAEARGETYTVEEIVRLANSLVGT